MKIEVATEMISSFLLVTLLCLVMVVGRESVLALADNREIRCGRRLVSGLFARPRLPLGYSYVTTVPRGACRLNVSEIVPNDNYIALKVTNGSYIMNGEFAVSAPGTYDAVGARFIYSRALGRDSVFAHGPLRHAIDIMILYTEPNPSIKYEYLTESLPGEIDIESITTSSHPDIQLTSTTKHMRRHHGPDGYSRSGINTRHPDVIGLNKDILSSENSLEENVVGARRFLWKITSYTQCTRTCGGGMQVGKYRCVEESADGVDREIAPVHCTGSPPPTRRRRCGNIPCPPRWRAAAWSSCPQCGPAIRQRIVGCVQDHSRGITKVSDQKCPAPKPSTSEKCNVPDCSEFNSGEVRQIETRRVIRPHEYTETFREGPVYTITVNSSDVDVGPEYSLSGVTAGWHYTDWSECVGWCIGGGMQTRSIRCGDPSGCLPQKSPEPSRNCTPKISCEPHDGHWFTGEWSSCSSVCGGTQVRGVLCIGGTGRHLRDSACKDPKPEIQRDCGGECPPVWYYSEWSQCVGNCSLGTGVQRRTVVCARGSNGARDGECAPPRPQAHRPCEPRCNTTSATGLTIESQKIENPSTSTQRSTTKHMGTTDCEDKLSNCALAVQARLCHYNYYIQNCCNSCRS